MGGPGRLICISDVAQVSCGVIGSVMRRAGEYMAKAWRRLVDKAVVIILVGLLVVLFGLFLAVMFCEGAESCISELLGLEEKHEVLKFLGIGMGGILLALQAFASHKRAKAMEDTANAQVEATKQQAKANENTEQGRRQERLKNAIEHLGNSSDSVRLGGAYELFHLAEDTPKLRQTVLDILCAHIRRTTGEEKYRQKHKNKPSEEIQSLLTLLFVQEYHVFEGLQINLEHSFLNGAHLDEAHLEKAALTQVQLQGAHLSWARLQGAELSRAQLQKARLGCAQLQGVNLRRAHLQGAHLSSAELQRANLERVQIQGADMAGAELQWANLRRAHLQGAYLLMAQLQGANLSEAQLQGARLPSTQLQEAMLSKTKMEGVLWEMSLGLPFEEDVRRQVGKDADTSGVIFEGGLSQEDLDSSCKYLPEEQAKAGQERLYPHVGKPASYKLPKYSEVTTGSYTAEEAEQWIAEYNEAMSEAPQADAD